MKFRSRSGAHAANRRNLVGIQDQRKRAFIGVENEIPGVGMHVHVVRMRQQMPLTTRQRDFNRTLDWPAQYSIK
jgi:hypothetical protein